MGKSLIIKGADFSESAIITVFNEVQTSLGANKYYNNSGHVVEVEGIEGVSAIEIPDGASVIHVVYSSTGYEPTGINCFDENMTYLGLSGDTGVGSFEALGTKNFELLGRTKYISYVYKNGYQNKNIGLALRWGYDL